MENFGIFYLICYGGFVVSLFGILLFYGLKRREVLNSRTAMLPFGMFLAGLGAILGGLGIIASIEYVPYIGLFVSLIGDILLLIGSILYLWNIWKTNPPFKR